MNLLIVLTLFSGVATDSLSLAQCYVEAEAHHPLLASNELYDRIASLQRQNVNATRLPSFRFGGQATYQSEVPSIPIAGSSGGVSNDQYRVSLGVEQVIYAGGLTGAQVDIENLKAELDRQNAAVEVYQIREQVDIAFFAVLLQESVLETLETTRSTVAAEFQQMEARIREGVVPAGAADVLQVEIIRIDQQIGDARANRESALSVLATLTGRNLDAETTLQTPDATVRAELSDKLRPEYSAMATGQSLLAAQEQIAVRKRRPQFGVTAEFAYGRPPGQNLFKDEFAPFFSAGFILRWSPWDWGVGSRTAEALRAQSQVVDLREEVFTRQLDIQTDRQRRDIARLEDLLVQDEQIIELRHRITAQASSRLATGVITATEYLLEENAERQSRLMRNLHRIQLSQAHARLATTIGV